MRPIALIAFALLLTMLQACAAPSQAGDPEIPDREPRTDLLACSELRLHRYSAKGSRIPDEAVRAAVATIERHTGRTIRVIDHGEADSRWGVGGPLAPIQDNGHPISGADIAAANNRYLLATPDDGILGAADVGEAGGVLPLVEPNTIILVELPGTEDGSGVTGYAGRVTIDAGPRPPSTSQEGMVVLLHSALVHRSGFFVSRTKLCQWTLTHELGHVLHVPESHTHTWFVPGLGPHCTNPNCVMYTGFDWRVLWTGIVRGWPMDFCDECTAELARVRAVAEQPPK